jgi:hypothetical protein
MKPYSENHVVRTFVLIFEVHFLNLPLPVFTHRPVIKSVCYGSYGR